jgi:putative ABC transport system permease protein
VLGRAYDINGKRRDRGRRDATEFEFPNDGTLLWISSDRAEGIRPGRFQSPLVARLKPGVTPEQLAAELTTLARGLPERFGGSPDYARLIEQHRAVVRPLEEELLGAVAAPLWILLGAGGVVLLVACANVANLFLVRAEARQRDLAVRRAIGAGRGAARAAADGRGVWSSRCWRRSLAVGLAALVLPAILRAAPPGIPRLDEVGSAAHAALHARRGVRSSALLCGLAPALRAARPTSARLREGGRGTTRRRRWARTVLVAGQTALALVLLIGSGLLLRSFAALRAVDPGYDVANVLTFQFAPEQARLVDGPSWARFHLDFLDRLAALPGVESVGLVENVPLNESTDPRRLSRGRRRRERHAGATSPSPPATTSAPWGSRSRPAAPSPPTTICSAPSTPSSAARSPSASGRARIRSAGACAPRARDVT